jgi:hypothetical protein
MLRLSISITNDGDIREGSQMFKFNEPEYQVSHDIYVEKDLLVQIHEIMEKCEMMD